MQNKIAPFELGTYKHLKHLVYCGFDLQEIKENMPAGVPIYILEELIERAKQELYVESNILPSEAGRVLYD